MQRRFILHAGFHKTATTSLQHFLIENSGVLSTQHSIWVSDFIKPISNKASKFSILRDTKILSEMAYRLQVYIEDEAKLHSKDIICSHEDFSGQLPGRADTNNHYDTIHETLPILCKTITDSGLFSEIIVYFSSRNHEKWLESLYWHLVQNFDLKLDFNNFKIKYTTFPKLEEIINKIRLKILDVKIVSANIDDYKDAEFGAITPFIDVINPTEDMRSKLQNIDRHRVRLPMDICLELLEINRNDALTIKVRQEQKRAIIEEYNQSQGK